MITAPLKVTLEKSTFRQKCILITYNFLLWLTFKLFKKNPTQMEKNSIELVKDCYKVL